jgi:D-3-phosphoglycerate dehydrogenase
MVKILVADKLAQEGIDLLKSKGVEAVIKTGLSEDELASIIGEYDGVIVRSGAKITAKVLENSGKLKGIARAGVGVDNIDIPEATRKGIIVMNTPGGNTLSAAEHTVALMLAMSRNVVPACNSLKAGAWDRKKYMGNQLNNKILGLIGLGRIGMAVAKMAQGFNMKVIGFDPLAAPANADKLGVEVVDDINRIYKESDYISVHVPRNEQTLNMINTEQFEIMKPTTRLVNCARGGIINEKALAQALTDKKVAGAGLDVFPKEPPEEMLFSDIDNCVVTPHLGASTQEAQIEVAVEAAEILVSAIQGGPIANALNAPSSAGATPAAVVQYSELARRIGVLVSSTTPGQIKEVQVQYRGSIAELDVASVTLNFSIGLLQKHFEIPLNMVNTPVMAKERGISIDETKNTEAKDVSSSFTAKVVTDKKSRTITGTIFGGSQLRIIDVDGFKVEFAPEDAVVVIFNDNKPGVIGSVGSVTGKNGINICTMGVGQKLEEQKAILAVSLNKEPGSEVLEELGKLDFVNEIYLAKLS